MAPTWLSATNSWPTKAPKVMGFFRHDDEQEEQQQSLITAEESRSKELIGILRSRSWLLHIFLAIITLLLLVIAIALTQLARQRNFPASSCTLLPSEFFDASHAPPVADYQDVIFTTPIWGSNSEETPIYDGPPTGKTNLMWHRLIDVGIIALTAEQSDSLPLATTRASAIDETQLVQLDVFHQLHCLNAIRKFVFAEDSQNHTEYTKGLIHINHCIDQIRQSLMCHADISIIYHVPRPHKEQTSHLPTWKANFSAPHTCRDFWAIHDWAMKYNTSGFEIERWNDKEFL